MGPVLVKASQSTYISCVYSEILSFLKFIGQCKTQTANYCFHHANEHATTIVSLFCNPKYNIPQSARSQSAVCILHCLNNLLFLLSSQVSHSVHMIH